jgi:hypothetical protein
MELVNTIETKIYKVRQVSVMLDSDLAKLYDVETKRINEAVRRNPERFPCDLFFEMTKEEVETLRSQNATFKESINARKYLPKVFTEQGVYMLATVLKSQVATEVTLTIMRTFTKMREFALNYKDIAKRIQEIEKTIKIDQQQQNYNTHRIDEAFELLHQILQDTQKTNNNLIGFRPKTPQDEK